MTERESNDRSVESRDNSNQGASDNLRSEALNSSDANQRISDMQGAKGNLPSDFGNLELTDGAGSGNRPATSASDKRYNSYPFPQAQDGPTCSFSGKPQEGQVSHYGGPGDPSAPDGPKMKNEVPYDHRKATIASNTLPMGTKVDIEYGGKHVNAEVTDTGGFSAKKYGGGRIADLSQGTFRELADPSKGKLNGVKIHKCD